MEKGTVDGLSREVAGVGRKTLQCTHLLFALSVVRDKGSKYVARRLPGV